MDDRYPVHALARHIARLVDFELDLTGLVGTYRGVGVKAVAPDLLLRLMLFETCRGRQSPSDWYEDITDSIAIRWLLMGQKPSKTTLYDFRERAAPFLDYWNCQLLAIAFLEGWTEAEIAALDGTLIEANASADKRANAAQLAKRIDLLERLLADGSRVSEPLPNWVAETESGRREQLSRYRRAMEILKVRLEENRKRRSDKRKPDEKIKVSYGDPDAVFGKGKEGSYQYLYNVQFMTDVKTPFVLGYQLLDQLSDSGTMSMMLDRVFELTGRMPKFVLADAGYPSGNELYEARLRNATVIAPWNANSFTEDKKAPEAFGKEAFIWRPDDGRYVCPEGALLPYVGDKRVASSDGRSHLYQVYQAPSETCQSCAFHEQCVKGKNGRTVRRQEHEDEIERLQERMQTPEAKELYKKRGCTVERSIGDIKEHRGLRRFSGRTKKRAAAQVAATVLAVNARTLFALRAKAASQNPEKLAV